MKKGEKWKKYNPIVTYEEVTDLELKCVLNTAYRILFEEIKKDEIEKRRLLNSITIDSGQRQKTPTVCL